MLDVIQQALKSHSKIKQTSHALSPASVLLPLFEKDAEIYLLLTRRSEEVEHHKGEISFPGGMRDPKDPDSVSTAIRETWEEIGIDPSCIEILGELDDHITVSGFNVTPFVGKISYPFKVNICTRELREVFFVPLSFFLEEKNYRKEFMVDSAGNKRQFYVFQFNEYRIWGATAAIILNFIQVVKPFILNL
jgi:8-oxo-dGTP pyrophosphatase MutT (NUDIX family)